jgi:two-component system nitrogen regulation sensor histidine kinase GlnL
MMAVAEPHNVAVGVDPTEPTDPSILAALPIAVIVVDSDQRIVSANPAAEQVLGAGSAYLSQRKLSDIVSADSQLVSLVDQVANDGNSVVEYGISLAGPKVGDELIDVRLSPIPDNSSHIVVCLEKRSMARLIDHQMPHRGTARSIAGMAEILAHEIKNPLAGIRGAAQLLEQSIDGADRDLTQLICDETDRIRNLVERVDVFSDDRPLARDRVNIHRVLEHVRRLVASEITTNCRFIERYDPSLPPVFGNRDQLVQVFLNLLKNAVEAVPAKHGEITISTRYQHGFKFASAGSRSRQDLPIVVSIQDNGSGIPEELHGHLFDPFVTTKRQGTGLGLSLVAKIIEDHGGLIEFETRRRRTDFRVRLPAAPNDMTETQGAAVDE